MCIFNTIGNNQLNSRHSGAVAESVSFLHAKAERRVEKFNKKNFSLDGMVEQNINRQFLFQIYLGQIPNPSTVHMKAYVLFLAICQLDGGVKLGGPLGAFRKQQANSDTGFFLRPSLTHTHHSYIYTTEQHLHTLILNTFPTLQLYISLQCDSSKWCRNGKRVTSPTLSDVQRGPNAYRSLHYNHLKSQ